MNTTVPCKFRAALRTVALLLAALLPACALAAPDVPPPLNALWDRDTLLGEATYVGRTEEGLLLFRDVRVVHGGQSRDELSLRADAKALALLHPGQRFVLAWQETRRSPGTKRHRVLRPEGPQLLDSVGLSPALFAADTPIRDLLLTPPDPARLQGKAHLERVLAGLGSESAQVQQLFAGEVFARESVQAQLDRDARKRLLRFVRDADKDILARDLVLQAAHLYSQTMGEGWPALAARLLAREPVSMAPGASNEGLAWTAFAIVESANRRLPVRTSLRWVRSGNGALAERALRALRRDAPERELPAIEQALAEPSLAAGTRELLLDHRRRLLQSSSG